MKRILIIVLIGILVVGAGFFAYIHYLKSKVLDGNMTNPNYISTPVMPTEGAKLISTSLNYRGELAEENYGYTIQLEDNEVLLYAEYYTQEGEKKEIEGEKIDENILHKLNTLILSLQINQYTPREDIPSDESPLDTFKNTCTVAWDDGTTFTLSEDFEPIEAFFETEIIQKYCTSTENTPIMEIELMIHSDPKVGSLPETNLTVSEGVTVLESYWWRENGTVTEEPFEKDEIYHLHIILHPNEGYTFPVTATGDATCPFVYQGNLSINNEAISISPFNKEGSIELDWWNKTAIEAK